MLQSLYVHMYKYIVWINVHIYLLTLPCIYNYGTVWGIDRFKPQEIYWNDTIELNSFIFHMGDQAHRKERSRTELNTILINNTLIILGKHTYNIIPEICLKTP